MTECFKIFISLFLHTCVPGVMFYMIGRELFSSQSPSGLYGKALKLCEKNDQVNP